MRSRKLLKGNSDMLVLAALNQGPMHGYFIHQWISTTSSEQFSLAPGMLYPLLHRLEKDGLISAAWATSEGERKKRIYSITPQGKRTLSSLKKEWTIFAKNIHRVIS